MKCARSSEHQLLQMAGTDPSDSVIYKEGNSDTDNIQLTLEKRRWLMLAIFSSITLLSAFQWMHLTIIAPSTAFFWNGSLPGNDQDKDVAIAWLSMIYMLIYIPMVFPGTWLLNRYGLRVALLAGSGLNAFGACIKCVALELSQPYGVDTPAAVASFPILMTAQCICALAQVFTLGMPAQLAATWFGESELALTTSIGVFSNQVGCAFGFAFPPLIVPISSNTNDFGEFRRGFRILLYGGAAIMLLSFIIVAIFFREEPKTPPSRAQLKRILQRGGIVPDEIQGEIKSLPISDADGSTKNSEVTYVLKGNFSHQILHCLKSVNFILLMICYGVNAGAYYEIGTLLNPIVSEYYPKEQVTIGWLGFAMIISGLIGALIAGLLLRKTGQYRRVFLIFYMLSVTCWAAFMGSLYSPHIAVVFVTMILLGFFQSGFLPLGFEYAAETTYPIEEGLTSGILNTSAQIFGIIFTNSATALLSHYGALVTNTFILVCLIVVAIPACFVKADLKRKRAQQLVPTGDE